MWAGAWGRKLLGRSMGMEAIFFLRSIFKKISSCDSNDFWFFTFAWKRGMGSDHLFHSLFSDLIFSCGWECEARAFGQERWDGSKFFLMIYFQIIISSCGSNDFWFFTLA